MLDFSLINIGISIKYKIKGIGKIKGHLRIDKFGRAKMRDLVSLLGGRDFETREYKEEIAETSFQKLTEGVMGFMNEYTFRYFVLTIKSAVFVTNKLINSQMTLDFAYTILQHNAWF